MATIGFAGAVALAASIAMGGCFGLFIPTERDPCEAANTHIIECGIGNPSDGSSGSQATCEAQVQCQAECINKADCGQLQDAFSGMPGSTSTPFLSCISVCATGK